MISRLMIRSSMSHLSQLFWARGNPLMVILFWNEQISQVSSSCFFWGFCFERIFWGFFSFCHVQKCCVMTFFWHLITRISLKSGETCGPTHTRTQTFPNWRLPSFKFEVHHIQSDWSQSRISSRGFKWSETILVWKSLNDVSLTIRYVFDRKRWYF